MGGGGGRGELNGSWTPPPPLLPLPPLPLPPPPLPPPLPPPGVPAEDPLQMCPDAHVPMSTTAEMTPRTPRTTQMTHEEVRQPRHFLLRSLGERLSRPSSSSSSSISSASRMSSSVRANAVGIGATGTGAAQRVRPRCLCCWPAPRARSSLPLLHLSYRICKCKNFAIDQPNANGVRDRANASPAFFSLDLWGVVCGFPHSPSVVRE